MTSLSKKILLTMAPLALLFCLCFAGLPGTVGTASAADRFNSSDKKMVIDYCKKALGSQASQAQIGACHQGYVFGYDKNNISNCDDSYNQPEAIKACRNEGYKGGQSNKAEVKEPRNVGGGGGGGAAAGSAYTCGDNPGIGTSINIGCKGKGNPIADMLFAVIRVLSAGVGLVVVGSIIVGGIQYSASRGDPQATALAINRIRSSLIALLIFIFGYALLNYIIPGAILK